MNDYITAEEAIKSVQKFGTKFTEEMFDGTIRLMGYACRFCGHLPVVADVGGNNPYYEVSCKCPEGIVIGSKNLSEAIVCWKIYNEVKTHEKE